MGNVSILITFRRRNFFEPRRKILQCATGGYVLLYSFMKFERWPALEAFTPENLTFSVKWPSESIPLPRWRRGSSGSGRVRRGTVRGGASPCNNRVRACLSHSHVFTKLFIVSLSPSLPPAQHGDAVRDACVLRLPS